MTKKSKIFICFILALVLTLQGSIPAFAEPDETTAGDQPAIDATETTDGTDDPDAPDDPDTPDEEEEEDSAVEKGHPVKMGIVKGTGDSGIYIRSLPSRNGKVLYGVAEDTELVIISNKGNWYKVAYYGHVGYASADYIVPYSESESEFGAGTVVGSYVNVRVAPDTESLQAGVLPEGTTVSIIGVEGGWYYIDYNAMKGYIHADYLYPIKDAKVNFTEAKVNVGSGVNLRTSTSTNADIVVTLNYGEEVKVDSILNGWYKVKYKNDGEWVSGYIHSDYLISSDEFVDYSSGSSGGGSSSSGGSGNIGTGSSSEGQRIVNYAANFLGYPYVWGGYTPSMGFDCSGFTQYVFAQCGYTLYNRTQQYTNGTVVYYSNLKVGDLVFFDTNENGTIGHVGIYAGNGQFIHAANPSKGVCYSDMSPGSYYGRVYVCARRIVW